MLVRWLNKAALFLCLMGVTLGANAQVVVDSSFGSGGALNGPNFQIPDNLGKTVGDNLFHSFAEFSLQTGQSAIFTGPDSIQNILGRVTGNKVSEIDGLIKSEITGTNLYLLNPKGFLFGENAKVDVDGAFTVSARESIKLGEEGSFNAVNPDQSVFVSATPEAFGFLGNNPGGDIAFSGSSIEIKGPDKSLELAANRVDLEDHTVFTVGDGASILIEAIDFNLLKESSISSLADVHGEGEIVVQAKTLTIESSEILSESSETARGGDIGLNTDVFSLGSQSKIISKGVGNYGAPKIEINANEANLMKSDISSKTQDGDAGIIQLKANHIDSKYSNILSETMEEGTGATISLTSVGGGHSDNYVNMKGSSRIVAQSRSSGTAGDIVIEGAMLTLGSIRNGTYDAGTGGEIRINGNTLFINNNILTISSGIGKAGDITLDAKEIEMQNSGTVASETVNDGLGGGINITGQKLIMKPGVYIATESKDLGDAGDIHVSMDYIEINGVGPNFVWFDRTESMISSNTRHRTMGANLPNGGKGGDIHINAKDILLKTGGSVRVITMGSGDAGVLHLNAEKLTMVGSGKPLIVFAGTPQATVVPDNEIDETQLSGQVWDDLAQGQWRFASGRGGKINVNVGELIMSKKARIRLQTDGTGNAGALRLKAGSIALNTGASIEANAYKEGRAGDLFIYTNTFEGSDAAISSFSKGKGSPANIVISPLTPEKPSVIELITPFNISSTMHTGHMSGGNIELKADLILLNGARIESDAGVGATGSAGGILLEADTISTTNRNFLSSTTKGRANGGRVELKGNLMELNMVSILTESKSSKKNLPGGKAGQISIVAGKLSVSQSEISSSTSGLGDAGRVIIKADELSIEGLGEGRKRTLINSNTSFGAKMRQEGKGGKAGTVRIEAGEVSVGQFATIASSTVGSGDAGGVEIKAGRLVVKGEGALVSGQSGHEYGSRDWERSQPAKGMGGSIEIEAETVEIGEGGILTVASTGNGAGGSINISAGAMTVADGGKVESSSFAEGDAGKIRVSGTMMDLSEGFVSSSSVGKGAAGSIELDLVERLELIEGSSVSVSSSQSDGGDIRVSTDKEVYLSGSELTASAAGDGGSVRLLGSGNVFMTEGTVSAEAGQDGGNIEISAPETLVLHRSGLVANAIQGDGGNISIMAEGFLPSRESVISASSEFGLEGSIEIETPETNVGGGLVELPERLVGAEVNLSDRCALMLSGDVSSFFLNGDGGVPVGSSVNYVPSVFLGDEDREE